MTKKLFILIAGTLMIAPIVIALCCNSFLFTTFAVIYAVVIWNSPKFSTRIRKFWLEFWKINIQAIREYEN